MLQLSNFKILDFWTSLVAQWIEVCLPMQETQVLSLVWEDSTCLGAAELLHHNYWAHTLESVSRNYCAHAPRACTPQLEKPPRWEARAPRACSTTGEATMLRSPCSQSLRSTTGEATTLRSPCTARKGSSHLRCLEKACVAMKTQPKINKEINIRFWAINSKGHLF